MEKEAANADALNKESGKRIGGVEGCLGCVGVENRSQYAADFFRGRRDSCEIGLCGNDKRSHGERRWWAFEKWHSRSSCAVRNARRKEKLDF